MGYLKNISADKEANYNTFSVVWGWDLTVWASDFIYMIVLFGFYFSGWISGFNWVLFFTMEFILNIWTSLNMNSSEGCNTGCDC